MLVRARVSLGVGSCPCTAWSHAKVLGHQDTFEVGEYGSNVSHGRVEYVAAGSLRRGEVSIEVGGFDVAVAKSVTGSSGVLSVVVFSGSGCSLIYLGLLILVLLLLFMLRKLRCSSALDVSVSGVASREEISNTWRWGGGDPEPTFRQGQNVFLGV